MRFHLVFVFLLAACFLGVDYYNKSHGQQGGAWLSAGDYVRSWTGQPPPPAPPASGAGWTSLAVSWAGQAGRAFMAIGTGGPGPVVDGDAPGAAGPEALAAAAAPGAPPPRRTDAGRPGEAKTFGTGTCDKRAGGKFCAVGGTAQD